MSSYKRHMLINITSCRQLHILATQCFGFVEMMSSYKRHMQFGTHLVCASFCCAKSRASCLSKLLLRKKILRSSFFQAPNAIWKIELLTVRIFQVKFFQVTTQQTQAPRAIWNIELLTVAHLCIPAAHSWRNFTCSKLHFLEKPHLFTWRNFTWTNCTWRHPPPKPIFCKN